MNHSRKMVLMPAEAVDQSTQTPPNNYARPEKGSKEMDKLHKLLNIVLKIASVNGYDQNFRIYDANGSPITNSDIVVLLNNAVTPGKILYGENDFIRLLYEAQVNPQWIVNENVRNKLLHYDPNVDMGPVTWEASTQTQRPLMSEGSVQTQRPLISSIPTQTMRSPARSLGTQTPLPSSTTSSGTQSDVPMETINISEDKGTQTYAPYRVSNPAAEIQTLATRKRQIEDEHNYADTEGTEPIQRNAWEVPLPDSDGDDDL
jgi:hypothetical protein